MCVIEGQRGSYKTFAHKKYLSAVLPQEPVLPTSNIPVALSTPTAMLFTVPVAMPTSRLLDLQLKKKDVNI